MLNSSTLHLNPPWPDLNGLCQPSLKRWQKPVAMHTNSAPSIQNVVEMRIYCTFLGKPQWMIGWPSPDFNNEQFRDERLEKLRKKFPDMDFVGGDIITDYTREKVEKIKKEIKNSDGLLLYTIGLYQDFFPLVKAGNELLELGVPAVLANHLYGGDYVFLLLYENARRKNLRVVPASSADYEKVEEVIGILVGVIRLKGQKIINITIDEPEIELSDEDRGRLMAVIEPEIAKIPDEAKEKMMGIATGGDYHIDVTGMDQCHQWRRDKEKYRKNLGELFGVEMVRAHPDDLIGLYEKVDSGDAEAVVKNWTEKAQTVDVTRETLVNSAKLYLAIKRLMSGMGADAITIDCASAMMSGKLPAFPCMPFAQLNSEGATAVCESDMDCAITALLGQHITGRPGFTANNAYDIPNNRITYLHCTAPFKLLGPEGPFSDYDILTHGDSRYVGASPSVKYPVGDLTTIKISVLEKKIALRHGRVLGSVMDEKGCRNKVLVEADAKRVLENYDEETFGWHRVSFAGESKDEMKMAAKLLGLEIVDEDD